MLFVTDGLNYHCTRLVTHHSGRMQCVAACCNLLQCAAVCCNVLQYAAVCCSVLQCAAVCCSVLQCAAVCCSVLQCVAICCCVLLCAAVCCCVQQCVLVCCIVLQFVTRHTILCCHVLPANGRFAQESTNHVTRLNKSCHTYKPVMSRVGCISV